MPRRQKDHATLRDDQQKIEEELRHHIAELTDRLVEEGMSLEEAQATARRRFGDLDRWTRELRDIATRRTLGTRLSSLGGDLRYAVRQLRRNPGFASMAVATLALGIGASTAIFGVIKAVVLDPLPYPEPEQLFELSEVTPDGLTFSVSRANYLDFAERVQSFEHLAAANRADLAMMTDDGPVNVVANQVTPSYFDVLGVEAEVGRTFSENEGGAEPAHVVLVSSVMRDRLLDIDPIGDVLVLDDNPYTIVGVMPEALYDPAEAEVWVPLAVSSTQSRGDHDVDVLGRLTDDTSLDRAINEARTVAATLGTEYPETNEDWGVQLTPLKTSLVGANRIRAGSILLGAVGLLLLLACGSVANLLIARSTTRHREMGVRVALGAPRGRLIQQLTIESLTLTLLAGAVGLLIAYVTIPIIQSVSPADTPRIGDARITPAVIVLTTVISLVTGLIFGLLPAFGSKRSETNALRSGARTTGRAGERLRRALVAGQVAATVALLVGAVLLGTSFLRMQNTDVGFKLASTQVVPLMLSGDRYSPEERRAATDAIRARLEAIPGVSTAGYSNVRPFSGMNTSVSLTVEGEPTSPEEAPFVSWRLAGPGYFQTAGLERRAGRLFEPLDYDTDAAQVVVLTQALAELLFDSESSAVGKRIAMGWNGTNWRTVIGVIDDFQDTRVAEEPSRTFFMPANGGWAWTNFLVRSESSSTAPSAQTIREAIWSVEPTLPVPSVQTLEASHDAVIAGPRFNLTIMTVFGVVALLLSVMGVYGVTLFAVSRRTQEIGIRLALGAKPESVVRMLLLQGVRLAVIGVGTGLALAVALSGFVESLLFDTPARDPRGLLIAGAVAFLAVVGSTLLPALRATRIEPSTALAAD